MVSRLGPRLFPCLPYVNLQCLFQGFHRSFKKLCASQLHVVVVVVVVNSS